ncbi:MAG: DUF3108 domain-containing protein [Prevotella sp.]|uniref:DUF3108 domain-containing protein n=1 Tax=Prevotella sp. TaxID=59823 RepID=UPI002A2E0D8E|nr:DUF3108 domain-containing protein [Prevotella sp.]MDD7317349.1 DUF3108 domain-containing protein [Prevotellaceae bacterium]MDY4019447.1 DUF3108 domain-containing protein [Prevotella sp.]
MKKTLLAILMLATFAVNATAQCSFRNTAFNSGESLTYNLYYNWQFVWVKAGTASMSVYKSYFKGQEAYRGSLVTRGNKRVDDLFVLRDTLLCYCSIDMKPLYYRKGAHEGKRYTVDEVWYTYKGGNTNLRQHRQKHDGTHAWCNASKNECVFDMMNIFLRARSFDPTNWKKGFEVKFPMADGNGIETALLRYRGKSTVKADNGRKYRCLELSYMELSKGKYKEVVRFYITDDKNHVPVRLDMFLRFGSAKAFLTSMYGVRNPVTSIVK